jgi:thiamine-phosphate pyrophosphorylase
VNAVTCLVTDRRRLPHQSTDDLIRLCGAASEARVDLIQVRERDLAARDLLAMVGRVLDVTRGTSTAVLVNDRLDVALAAGARGVHLRGDSVPAPAVRTLLPRPFTITRAVHDPAEAEDAASSGAVDLLVFGTVYASPSKPRLHAVAGLGALGEAVARSTVPVLAIGGVDETRFEEIATAGAAGVAAIDLFVRAFRSGPAELRRIVQRVRDAFGEP